MRVLVLGGTHHVGRCLVEEALRRGDEVDVLNRGRKGELSPGAHYLKADRTVHAELQNTLATGRWNVVVDTWSSSPVVVQEAVQLLRDRVDIYLYISSRSVYQWPLASGLDESGPLVSSSSSSTTTEYAEAKRGAELAVVEGFGERCLIARPGLVLGPYEVVGRLPWWLGRMKAGGRIVAPGPRSRGIQYIDARDLAQWLLQRGGHQEGGIFNTVSAPDHTSMGALLEECRRVANPNADLVWLSPQEIEEAGLEPWTQLPIWLPPTGEATGLHDGNGVAAQKAGLFARAMEETVLDTWNWSQGCENPLFLSKS